MAIKTEKKLRKLFLKDNILMDEVLQRYRILYELIFVNNTVINGA